MEQEQNYPPQDNHFSQPIQQKTKKNTLLLIFVSVFLTAILVGGGMFFLQQAMNNNLNSSLNQQLEQIQIENAQLRDKLEDLEIAASEAIAEKEAIEKKTCKGIWQNGVCVQSTCIDSDVNEKPDDIYIKGYVTYTDENGVETTVYDECTPSKTQVIEMWCYESPAGSGNYVAGRMVYDCENGCFDGACIR